MIFKKIALFIFQFIIISFFTFSCSSTKSYTKRYNTIENLLQKEEYQKAIKKIENDWKKKKYSEKDKILFYLDMGICNFYANNYEKSIIYFGKAERAIEQAFTKSVSRAATSILLNDNVLTYSGEDYEDIYLNVFKALSYLELDKFDDAFVEIRRINNKLSELSLKYENLITNLNKSKNAKVNFKKGKIKFHNDAIGRYLSLLLYRTEGEYDDALIDKKKINQLWEIENNVYDFQIPTFVENSMEDLEKTKLNVIAFAGKGPEKYSVNRVIESHKNFIIVMGDKPQKFKDIIPIEVKPGYHFKFSLPRIKKRKSKISSIEIYINGKKKRELELLENMSDVAIATYKIKEPIIYLKSVIRTVIKGIAAQKGKAKIRKQANNNLLAAVLGEVVDAAVDLSENADLRGWRIIPEKCYIGEYKIDKGIHDITINYLNSRNMVIDKKVYRNFEIKKSLNILTSFSYQ